MRCLSCNTNLSDRESTRKYASSGEFLDLCDLCFEAIKGDVSVVENHSMSNSLDEEALVDRFLEKYENERIHKA